MGILGIITVGLVVVRTISTCMKIREEVNYNRGVINHGYTQTSYYNNGCYPSNNYQQSVNSVSPYGYTNNLHWNNSSTVTPVPVQVVPVTPQPIVNNIDMSSRRWNNTPTYPSNNYNYNQSMYPSNNYNQPMNIQMTQNYVPTQPVQYTQPIQYTQTYQQPTYCNNELRWQNDSIGGMNNNSNQILYNQSMYNSTMYNPTTNMMSNNTLEWKDCTNSKWRCKPQFNFNNWVKYSPPDGVVAMFHTDDGTPLYGPMSATV